MTTCNNNNNNTTLPYIITHPAVNCHSIASVFERESSRERERESMHACRGRKAACTGRLFQHLYVGNIQHHHVVVVIITLF